MTTLHIVKRTPETVKKWLVHCVLRRKLGAKYVDRRFSAEQKRRYLEGGGKYLERDEVCLFSRQLSKTGKRAGAALPAELSLARVLAELFSAKRPKYFVSRVREWMCVDEKCVIRRECAVGVCKVGVEKQRFLFYLR